MERWTLNTELHRLHTISILFNLKFPVKHLQPPASISISMSFSNHFFCSGTVAQSQSLYHGIADRRLPEWWCHSVTVFTVFQGENNWNSWNSHGKFGPGSGSYFSFDTLCASNRNQSLIRVTFGFHLGVLGYVMWLFSFQRPQRSFKKTWSGGWFAASLRWFATLFPKSRNWKQGNKYTR